MQYTQEAQARAQSIVDVLIERGESISSIQATLTELEIAALAGINGRDSTSNYCRHLAREYHKAARNLIPKVVYQETDTWKVTQSNTVKI